MILDSKETNLKHECAHWDEVRNISKGFTRPRCGRIKYD